MSPPELAAFRAGILPASHVAIIAATEIELRDDAGKLRQRAAIEALRGLAEDLKAQAITTSVAPSTETAE